LSAQYAGDGPGRVQLLPTLRARVFFDAATVTVAAFDHFAIAPAELSVEYRGFTLGYVAPLGALAGARFRLAENTQLDVTALAFRLGNAEVALLTLSGVYGATK